ncbi:MAG: hypothetical protein LPK00_13825 [Bacillaceae bacterium]|nr:hypothetical protein [Bacillaceae bacterium]
MNKEIAIELLSRTDVFLTPEGASLLEAIVKEGTSGNGVQTDCKVS